ncbi:MAG: 3'-kinase [Phenylobacterium sp.]|nr:3'-kinase [Phenylobacterium sp.]
MWGVTGTRFHSWLDLWGLTPDGEAFTTEHTASWLLPVRQGEAPAMLKLAYVPEEREGAAVMEWWAGQGAAQVLARQDEALLLERAMGPRSLIDMARTGQDETATTIICDAVAGLHAPRGAAPPSSLAPLDIWFRELEPMATKHGGVLADALKAAGILLATPQDVVVLHGDVHHGNILDFDRGWLAIDPKGLLGERGYDYANPFCNPDTEVAAAPGRLQRHVQIVSQQARIEPTRLLMWILAYAGLSAAWILGDGDPPLWDFTIARIAAAELAQTSVL